MSEVTLHGQPVRVGDKVWHIRDGITVVKSLLDNSTDICSTTLHHIKSYPEQYFWKPIDPAAIEAAKVKPKEPEYEWQFVYSVYLENGSVSFNTTGFFKSSDLAHDHLIRCLPKFIKIVSKIEESKREVTP